MADESSGQPTVRSVERAFDVLEALERSDAPLRLVDLCRQVDLHPATVLRSLAVLQRRGIVVAENQTYRLGVGVLRLAHGFLVNDQLSQQARPIMQRLTAVTGLTSSLYVRSSFERVLSVRVDGNPQLHYQVPIGSWLPLYIGSGKAITAHLPEDEQEAVIAMSEGYVMASGKPIDAEHLRQDLDRIRKEGYSLTTGERNVAVAAAGAVVTNPAGDVLGVLSVSGPSEHTSDERLQQSVPELQRAAHALSGRHPYS
ncbi:IclR family transcriptional regulator [Nocardiopsis sp. CT-R113]|uniref:IclR family transcriptional regulator n=1 Tax=Nocardiopsis codii TaxID=3065942 RepID=A0ABU7KF27_9ACTN|nr:IclR family transcriptional regulator [Nocardiopsis sp. CT-R113]MEE2040843.1 IclR family transcriptional regulator [Nocardiopsis sp. CT-R113]